MTKANDAAVFSADYVDLRFVKSRKVAQIVIEIAIEQAAAFVASFGTPNPASGVPVAIARIDPKAASEPVKAPADAPKERRRVETLPFSQQTGLRCGDPRFQTFVRERYGWDDAPDFVRHFCAVKSRSEIVLGHQSGDHWKNLDDEYLAWLSVDA